MAIVDSFVDPTGIAGAIINPIAKTAMVPVTDHVSYMISCKKYVRDMQTKMSELDIARANVESHMDRNRTRHFEIPSQVRGWLDKVEEIKANVENVSSDVISCCSLRIRHKLGRKAFKITRQIESVTRQLSLITWTEDPVPLGRVHSINASTSAPVSDHHDNFLSREHTFTEALKALGPNHKGHMVALCGMGGVGKTTMMQRIKKVAKEMKLFNYIVEAVIGEKTDPLAIQEAIADYLGIQLYEKTKSARADKIHEWFKDNSDGGKTKFLIILDDVWQLVDLNDIGLSHFPNQGVDFKILLTSRDRHVCTMMGVEVESIFNVGLLMEAEAHNLFWKFVENSNPELQKIGEDIVRKCCGLPIAIKTMACTLRTKSNDAWKDALSRLVHHDIGTIASKVFETSYVNLQDEETKSIFMLCGLFPEDFDISVEELVRYGWGLKLFMGVPTIKEARYRLNTSIEQLLHTNLLMEGNVGCVKMHDLVLAFVLDMFSKVEHASVVDHGSMSGWLEKIDMVMTASSCKRISLTCKGMSKLPKDLKFPNLSVLKLMHGDKLLKFPKDFYEDMEKLRVISYDKMKYPLLPSSPQCSTNLRVLHLQQCSLKMLDCSSIGNLSNLEVLSFADSGIEWLPSTIGNLKELRLLDLTNCYGLRIETGVLKKLVKLEELYMRVGGIYRNAISLTDENCNELAERSKTLSTLEFQFFNDNAQLPMNMSFEKLVRFKISMGHDLDGDYMYSSNNSMHTYENTLKLVTYKLDELLESKMNEMFKNTHVLYLEVGDMIDLEDVEVKSSSHIPPQFSSFYNLRVLVVSGCRKLRFLFTLSVANTLSKLEHLEVESCDNMEELVHSGSTSSEEETLTFPKLKFLALHWLRKLSSLCHNVKVIKLPELMKLKLVGIPVFTSIYPDNKLETLSFLKEEFVIPKLERLHITHMKKLKEIWPCEFRMSEEVKLREINMGYCDNLLNLFPCNPMPLIHHLEELEVSRCGSIEALFDIDLDSLDGSNGEGSSSLKSIKVDRLGMLREVWRIKRSDNSPHLHIRSFQAVESIWIEKCERFKNVFTPITSDFYLEALVHLTLNCKEDKVWTSCSSESSQEQINIPSEEEETSNLSDNISNVVFTSSLIQFFHNLRKLELRKHKEVEVVFEIESQTTTHHNQRLLPHLEELDIRSMYKMTHVWKCNWNKLLILQSQPSDAPFHNLTTIYVAYCRSIKYLFSPLMGKLLSNLKKVQIKQCDGIEEVVSNRDDEDEEEIAFTSTSTSFHTNTNFFPHLEYLGLNELPNLKCIGGGGYANAGNNEIFLNNSTTTTAAVDQSKSSQAGGVSWTLSQYAREISIIRCDGLSSVIPCYASGQMQKVQVLRIDSCKGMKEVFESENKNSDCDCDEGNGGTQGIPGLINHVSTVLKLANLKELHIETCILLEHVFPFPTLESLTQLEKLSIKKCYGMKVILKKQEDDREQQTTTTKASSSSSSFTEVVVFPRLKSIDLEDLPELVGFFLGMNEFQFPSLGMVIIIDCPKMMVFAPGGSTAPRLKYIKTSFGIYSVDQHGLNFLVPTTAHNHQTPFPSLDGARSFPATSEWMPWSFHNLIEIDLYFNKSAKKVIPSNELLQVEKLENIRLRYCDRVEEVFEARRNSSSGFDKPSQTTLVKLPNLTEMKLGWLSSLRYIWKSNQWTVFEFPNLTRVNINCCNNLEHAFSSSMVGSLLQLQELDIRHCKLMEEVIVRDSHVVEAEEEDGSLLQLQELDIRHCKLMEEVIVRDSHVVEAEEEEEESNGKTNEIIVLPSLKSLTLEMLPCLKGFSLGNEDFSFPLLDTLVIRGCTTITTFTKGNSAIPELKEIETSFGSFYVAGEDINFFIKVKQEAFQKMR